MDLTFLVTDQQDMMWGANVILKTYYGSERRPTYKIKEMREHFFVKVQHVDFDIINGIFNTCKTF